MNAKRTSKLLSLILRHKPGTVGIELDRNGWVDVNVLLEALKNSGHELSRTQLETIVRDNDKQRFILSEDRIRANQGHSLNIELDLVAKTPPQKLYHGTASRFLEQITQEGLKKMTRQHVHLSDVHETAVRVGTRHGKPVVLEVNSGSMHADGFDFVVSANGVWLVDNVPYKYLKELKNDTVSGAAAEKR